jgi:hypothetical protein
LVICHFLLVALIVNVVLLSGDLMVISRVGGSMRGGAALSTVGNAQALLERCQGGGVNLAIVDLSAPGLNVGGIMAGLSANEEERPRTVAFGPHVQKALLAAAESAGFDRVMSRGQFFAMVDEIIASAQ